MENLAVFGNPIEHSLSPIMHNFVYRRLGIAAEYKKIRVENAADARATFFDRGLLGANITVPHKEAAFALCDEVRGIAEKIGAANAWVREGGKIIAYNTDAEGFALSIRRFGSAKNALILGAGGAARALAIALVESGIEPFALNRSPSRLEFFKDRGVKTAVHENAPQERFDLVINATSAGLKNSDLPLERSLLERYLGGAKAAIDIVYGAETPFLRAAKEAGAEAADGLDMLIFQGAIAHGLFFPEFKAREMEVAALMREALNV